MLYAVIFLLSWDHVDDDDPLQSGGFRRLLLIENFLLIGLRVGEVLLQVAFSHQFLDEGSQHLVVVCIVPHVTVVVFVVLGRVTLFTCGLDRRGGFHDSWPLVSS